MADQHAVEILAVEQVTHDVKRFVVSRPEGYDFEPGQATEVAIDADGWRDQKRPFTFTSLTSNPNLEFTIKGYPDHDGMTKKLHTLGLGDTLLLEDAWGAITYRGSGTFIAGGAGVTPFIAILRDLERRGEISDNRLLFSNKTAGDIILRGEFTRMLGPLATFTLTQERNDRCEQGRIDQAFLERRVPNFDQHFYVCGPPDMVDHVNKALESLGASSDSVVVEE